MSQNILLNQIIRIVYWWYVWMTIIHQESNTIKGHNLELLHNGRFYQYQCIQNPVNKHQFSLKILGGKKNCSDMFVKFNVTWPVSVVSQSMWLFRGQTRVLAFSTPTALVTAASGKKGLWVVWCIRLRFSWGKSSSTGSNNKRLMVVRWRASILSLKGVAVVMPILMG